MSDPPRAPLSLADLERWELFGASWRVRCTDPRLIVDLCTCTGELVESREVTDPALRSLLVGHEDSSRGFVGPGER